jgi:hypothetical protein
MSASRIIEVDITMWTPNALQKSVKSTSCFERARSRNYPEKKKGNVLGPTQTKGTLVIFV